MTIKLQTLVAVGVLAIGLGVASPASAEECVFSTPDAGSPGCSTDVESTELPGVEPQVGRDIVAAKSVDVKSAAAQLPVTGSETLLIVGLGAALVVGGGLLVSRSRKAQVVA